MSGSVMRVVRVFVGAVAVAGAMALPSVASAAPPASVFDGAVPCTVQGDGTSFCSDTPRSTVPAWDGVPIDVNVALPDLSLIHI